MLETSESKQCPIVNIQVIQAAINYNNTSKYDRSLYKNVHWKIWYYFAFINSELVIFVKLEPISNVMLFQASGD